MKLDLQAAYNLVRIHKRDAWETSFPIQYGHFEYTVILFGLNNASTMFMHDVFWDLLDTFVVICLDDILVYSSAEKH